MVIESPLHMLSDVAMRAPPIGGGGGGGDRFSSDDLEKELGLLLREQRRQEAIDRDRELNLFRSGSAPPTVEGSLAAVGGLLGGGFNGGGGLPTYVNNGNAFSSEEELRSDPAYLDYYYSNVNLNPRLPPPLLSKEDWRMTQRLQAGNSVVGGIGDRRKVIRGEDGGNRSLFSQQPGLNSRDVGDVRVLGSEGAGEWLDRRGDGLIGLPGLAVGSRRKSFADILQDDLLHLDAIPGQPSRPTSRNAFNHNDMLGSVFTDEAKLPANTDLSSTKGLQGSSTSQASVVRPIGPSTSRTFASVLGGSSSRSVTPDPQVVPRASSPCLPPVGVKISANENKVHNGPKTFSGASPNLSDSTDIAAAFSSMNLSSSKYENNHSRSIFQAELKDNENIIHDIQAKQNHDKQQSYLNITDSGRINSSSFSQSINSSFSDFGKIENAIGRNSLDMLSEQQVHFQRHNDSFCDPYFIEPSAITSSANSPSQYQNTSISNAAFTSYGQSGFSLNSAMPGMLANHIGTGSLPPLFENAAVSVIGSHNLNSRVHGEFSSDIKFPDVQEHNLVGNHAAAANIQMPLMNPLYMQYMRTADYAAQLAGNYSDPAIDKNYVGNVYQDLSSLQKAYLETILTSQNQYGMPFSGKSGNSSHNLYGNLSSGLGMSYPGSPIASHAGHNFAVGPGIPLRHGERSMRYPSGLRSLNGSLMRSWNPDALGNPDEGFASTLLDEFKSNKAKSFELSEIAGHVVEFSADQYGSRFIQQKLETATTEEKNMVFEEIISQAFSLMTDVFGNYVIQKFFEHGSSSQIRELADQLTGHVLTLSLQMYGCRVIQKAIEVVDLDQQTKMVAELNGHVMRCVRDQNGNHVIQKCIECIPQDAIQFIISSFYEQVVTLSTHPYGCRVIQRVLEHCDDSRTQEIVMDEIMQCVCMLAQDQYGNYVVQHVLEHGKPHERSAIIKMLSGQIVKMSQQKFASNVIEKCLTFGSPEERQNIVNEILGSTDENEPLQAMMKDQFANYVVQKVLETCDDQQRELIMSRIKTHLNALKKYTYGKHIVARVEKLVAAGERRIAIQAQYASSMA